MRQLSPAWLAALCALGIVGSPPACAAAPETAAPCTAPEYRIFDFWLGDWDVFDAGGTKPSARVRVQSVLGGCVLLETYRDFEGHEGQSFSIYDATRGVWHQTWVTNHGRLLQIEGHGGNGVVNLSGSDRRSDGQEEQVRGTWRALDRRVRETASTSIDGGKTWSPWFDLEFRPHLGGD